MITPMYTVASCFGKDKKAAAANVHTDIPHVENTAVVTFEGGVNRPASAGERENKGTYSDQG
jgi:hypothetical protein